MASEKQQTNKSQIVHSLSSDQRSDTTTQEDLRFLMNSSTNPIIIILDDDNDDVTPEPPKKKTKLGTFNYPTPFNYSGSLISNNSIIIILDDEDDKTLEPPKNNKTRLGFQIGYVDPFEELGVVVRGLTKTKEDFASKHDSYFSPTDDLNENKNNENSSIILESPKNNETKLGLRSGYVDPFDELSVVVKGFQKRKEEKKENQKVPESKGYGYLEDSDEGLISIPFPWEDLEFDLIKMETWLIPS